MRNNSLGSVKSDYPTCLQSWYLYKTCTHSFTSSTIGVTNFNIKMFIWQQLYTTT